jgi:hypothetical protein
MVNNWLGRSMEWQALLADGVVELFEYSLDLELPSSHGTIVW